MVWLKAKGRTVLLRDECGTMRTIGAQPVELKKPAELFEHDADLEIVKKPKAKKTTAKNKTPIQQAKKPEPVPETKPEPEPEPKPKPKRRRIFGKKAE